MKREEWVLDLVRGQKIMGEFVRVNCRLATVQLLKYSLLPSFADLLHTHNHAWFLELTVKERVC